MVSSNWEPGDFLGDLPSGWVWAGRSGLCGGEELWSRAEGGAHTIRAPQSQCRQRHSLLYTYNLALHSLQSSAANDFHSTWLSPSPALTFFQLGSPFLS